MSAEAHALFEIHLFGQTLGVTSQMTTMTGITAGLATVSYFATRKMEAVPKGLQNAMEMIVEKLQGFLSGVIGPENARLYLPILGTLFLFIITSNYSGLLPGAGHLPGLAAPTSVLGVTAGLAVCVFFCTHGLGFKVNGIHYLKHFASPLLPLLIIEEFVRPLSLSLRLYGNIFGEETVVEQIFGLIPLFVPIPFMVLGLLFGFLQALVFTMLSSIYIRGAVSGGH